MFPLGSFFLKKKFNGLLSPVALGRSKNAMLRRSWSSTTTTASMESPVKLHEGSQVLLTSSSEMGTIRYIGPTDFAPGIWLGLELRSAKGRNDGSVNEKRYFTCKPNYGVLVRPSRVTYRGINGAKLVDDIWRLYRWVRDKRNKTHKEILPSPAWNSVLSKLLKLYFCMLL